MKRYRWTIWSGLLLLGALPVMAQTPNFGTLTLGNGKMTGVLRGRTGGTTSLPAIISTRDRDKNTCLGFGSPMPDVVLKLQQRVSKLTLTLTNAKDATLLVSGPGGVRCVDGDGSNTVELEDEDWQSGTYQIWVGTINKNDKRDYRLSVQAK
jgi:hypothetical protein